MYSSPVRKGAFLSSPEKVFLFLGIVYGIVFLLITPPFQVPDEPNHYYRAYQVSEGRLAAVKQPPPVLDPDRTAEREKSLKESRDMLAGGNAETVLQVFHGLKDTGGIGGFLPESLATTAKAFFRLLRPENRQNVRDIFPLLMLPLDKDKRIFIHFPNTAIYSPVPYLPQAFGIALGKILHSSPLILMYLGRMTNLFVWIFLVYLAIKVTPVCKWVFLLLALMPMSLFQAASLSADSFTYGISFLFIAVCLRSALTRDDASGIRIIVLCVLSLLLSLSKQAYLLMPLLFLLIPVERLGTRRKFYAIFFLLCLLDIGAVLLWTLATGVSGDIYTLYSPLIPTLSAKKQILAILFHPLEYCTVVVTTFVQNGRLYMDSFVGQLGWFDTPLPGLLRFSYIFMLFVSLLPAGRKDITLSLKQRGIIFATLLLSVLAVSTLAFIGWTPVGGKSINMQGRYFIPLSPLFFLLFSHRIFSSEHRSSGVRLAIASYAVFSLTYTAYVLIGRYYIP